MSDETELIISAYSKLMSKISTNPLLLAFISTFFGLIIATILGLLLYPSALVIGWITTILIAFPVSFLTMRQINKFRNQIEAQRLKAHIEQERVQILAKFIRNASHEFRTPLSIISLSTSLIQHSTHPEKVQSRLDKINRAVDDINLLVENMIRLAKLDAMEEYPSQRLSLGALTPHIEAIFHKNRDKDLSLVLSGISDNLNISGNQEDLLFALNEVLKNACQASSENDIVTVNVYQSNSSLKIEIQDEGEGMASDVLNNIFERFYRQDMSHTTRGMGLGLPIAKRIIELHKGTIEVTSELGVGTEVTISLPSSI